MAQITIKDGNLNVVMSGLETFFTFRHEITIPLTHITGVEVEENPMENFNNPFSGDHAMKAVGARLPGMLAEGTFFTSEGLSFLDIHQGVPGIVLSTTQERYAQLVIGTPDATAIAAKLREEIRG